MKTSVVSALRQLGKGKPASLYPSFLSALSGKHWKRIGRKRRSGVAVPLFSIYSSSSIGIGELPDLKLLVDWCRLTGMSLIQLLPINDVGYGFTPYDAQSTFALEPMYLSLEKLTLADIKPFRRELEFLRRGFAFQRRVRVDYDIKAAKLELLWKIFEASYPIFPTSRKLVNRSTPLNRFLRENATWLKDYALYKVLKEKHQGGPWWEWPAEFCDRKPEALASFEKENCRKIEFYQWIQFELFRQFKETKTYAAKRGLLLVGDLPLLVSRDSADVWTHADYFKLEYAAGAPPDMYCAKGQRWGMPPYEWGRVAAEGHAYFIQRLRYAENFYDLFRIDHAVGLFRLWNIPWSEPLENLGLNGFFDPQDENLWEDHGRRILEVILNNTKMLPCAEDLGVVPECSFKVLEEFAIPGTDVQRWSRDWGKTYEFKPPESYRPNSVATISTHDMTPLITWWECEAGTVDERLFRQKCESRGISFDQVSPLLFDFERSGHGRLRWKREVASVETLLEILGLREEEARDFADLYRGSFDEKQKFWNYLGLAGECEEKMTPRVARKALEKAAWSTSIFNIQLIQDWLALAPLLKGDPWDLRINWPGVHSERNWTFRLPISLEEMKRLRINEGIKEINKKAGRG